MRNRVRLSIVLALLQGFSTSPAFSSQVLVRIGDKAITDVELSTAITRSPRGALPVDG